MRWPKNTAYKETANQNTKLSMENQRLYRARFFGHKFDLSGVLHGGLLPGETRLTRAA
jgi:hypothetical protein